MKKTSLWSTIALALALLWGCASGTATNEKPEPQASRAQQGAAASMGKAAFATPIVRNPQWAAAPKNLKIAALYFKLANDTFSASGEAYSEAIRCMVAQWPLDSISPKWFGQLLIDKPFDADKVDEWTAEKPASLTTFFYQMSNGKLWLYGDEVAYSGPPIQRAKAKLEWQKDNQAILQWFMNTRDTRSLDNDGDGYLDLVLLICRARAKFAYGKGGKGHYQGVANGDFLPAIKVIRDVSDVDEPVFRVSNSVQHNSGLYQTDCYALSARNIIIHELGHKILKLYHMNGLYRWNLMSGAGRQAPTRSGVVLSAYEKMLMHWLTPIVVTETRRNFVLGDLTASDEAVKIPVTNGYFLLEYRKNRRYFEITPESECDTPPGLPEGLLVSYAIDGREPRIRAADGKVQSIMQGRTAKYDGDASDLLTPDGKNEITPYTQPNTDDHRRQRTGIAIKNLRYQGDKLVFDILMNYWQGEISKDAVWSGEVNVGREVTVKPGVTLKIQPGTTVQVTPGARLVVQGNLQAMGTEAQPIIFTRSAQQDWGGLVFEQTSGSGSELRYVTLLGAKPGLQKNGAKPRIEHLSIGK